MSRARRPISVDGKSARLSGQKEQANCDELQLVSEIPSNVLVGSIDLILCELTSNIELFLSAEGHAFGIAALTKNFLQLAALTQWDNFFDPFYAECHAIVSMGDYAKFQSTTKLHSCVSVKVNQHHYQ